MSMTLSTEQRNKKLAKHKVFIENPALAMNDELQEVNDNLKALVDKELPKIPEIKFPEIQKIEIPGIGFLKGDKGDKGDDSTVPGPEGKPSTVPGPKGPKGERGSAGPKGSDADETSVTKSVITALEPLIPKEETAENLRDKLETLREDERLDISAVKGFEQTIADLKGSGKTIRMGASRGIQLFVGGTKKGLAQWVNLVAGPNMTISDSIVNGLHTITFTSTGGGGFTKLSATETPDSSRTTFTFAAALAKPSFLVVDNVWLQPITATGTVNWTWLGTVATLTIPAVDDIWGVV